MRLPTTDHLQNTAIRVLVSLLAALLALAVLAPAGAGSQEVRVQQQTGATGGPAKLLSGLGSHHHKVTTTNPLAHDLKRFPENGWSLFGLRHSLAAQGKSAKAAEIARRFERAWRMADVKLTGSRF